MMSKTSPINVSSIRVICTVIGIIFGVFCLLLSRSFPSAGVDANSLTSTMIATAGIAIIMATCWITEIIPIPATSLIPLAAFPLLKILTTKDMASAYGSPMVLLLMGGFMIATTIEKVNLHQRIALLVIKKVGTKPHRLLLGLMCASAVLSMWISNTATTLMLLPIILAVANKIQEQSGTNVAIPLLLGIAYSASIGGTATPIGTPPNLIMLAQYNTIRVSKGLDDISFAQWMAFALPIVVIMIGFLWFYLCKFFHLKHTGTTTKADAQSFIDKELRALGNMAKPEKITFVIFVFTCFAWIFRKDLNLGFITLPGWASAFGVEKFATDTTVAITAAVLMFCIPISSGTGDKATSERLLDWETATKIPWGLLLLFGGGIALAQGFQSSGLSEFLGQKLQVLSAAPPILMILGICLFMTFLTEITSNTAVTTVMMPILAVTATAIDVHPAVMMVPAAISASFAFMMPVATAPNAIVYGSHQFTIETMAKVGFWLNLTGAVVVSVICYFLQGLYS